MSSWLLWLMTFWSIRREGRSCLCQARLPPLARPMTSWPALSSPCGLVPWWGKWWGAIGWEGCSVAGARLTQELFPSRPRFFSWGSSSTNFLQICSDAVGKISMDRLIQTTPFQSSCLRWFDRPGFQRRLMWILSFFPWGRLRIAGFSRNLPSLSGLFC